MVMLHFFKLALIIPKYYFYKSMLAPLMTATKTGTLAIAVTTFDESFGFHFGDLVRYDLSGLRRVPKFGINH